MLDETQVHLASALDGDAKARGELLERLRPRIVLWAAARLPEALRPNIDPEDAAQEILLALHAGLESFQGNARAFRAWLFTVAENKIRDLLDHAGAQKRQKPDPMSFSQTSPSTAAIRGEAAVELRAAVARLPEDYRKVIQLRRFEELDTAEVAEAMGRSAGAVRVLYFRAIQALKEEIAKGA